MKKSRSKEMWEYLQKSGVLNSGDTELIQAAKREYRREYLKKYRIKHRKKKRQITIYLEPLQVKLLESLSSDLHITKQRYLIALLENKGSGLDILDKENHPRKSELHTKFRRALNTVQILEELLIKDRYVLELLSRLKHQLLEAESIINN